MTDWTTLAPGAPILRWAMAAPEERYYPGMPRPMPDRVDYRFENAKWTEVPALPCREALLAALPDTPHPAPRGSLPRPPDRPRRGGARLLPLLLPPHARHPRLPLPDPRRGPARFRIGTCGGVRLWIGDTEAAVFEPFTRNLPAATEVTLDLPADPRPSPSGSRTCTNATRSASSPSRSSTAGRDRAPPGLRRGGRGRRRHDGEPRTDRVFYTSGPVRLIADAAPARRRSRSASPTSPPSPAAGSSPTPRPRTRATVTSRPTTPTPSSSKAEDAPPGCVPPHRDHRRRRHDLAAASARRSCPKGHPLPGDLPARKARAADLIAAHTGFEPSVAALLALRSEQPGRVARILAARARHHRGALGLLGLLHPPPPPPLARRARHARPRAGRPPPQRLPRLPLLARRAGDDVMWFWSENHVLCFHTAQLVAGRLFPDATFPNSGKTGRQHAAQAAARLDRWFASILEHGLCEWNSAAYYPIDLLGLLTLHDMAPEFRDRAAAVMDRIFVMAALHTSGNPRRNAGALLREGAPRRPDDRTRLRHGHRARPPLPPGLRPRRGAPLPVGLRAPAARALGRPAPGPRSRPATRKAWTTRAGSRSGNRPTASSPPSPTSAPASTATRRRSWTCSSPATRWRGSGSTIRAN
jgi:hypothetical protein